MKYLKLYEYVHGVLIKASKLKKLCNDSLAYLIDDGFKVSFKREDNILVITIKHRKDKVFTWDEIKYDFISFIEILNKEFEIVKQSIYSIRGTLNVDVVLDTDYSIYTRKGYSIEEITNDKVEHKEEIGYAVINRDIIKITIKVK